MWWKNKAGKSRRVAYWLAAVFWVGLIYSTLSMVRPLCEFLRTTIPFGLFVNALIGLWLFLFAKKIFAERRPLRKSTIISFLIITSLYMIGMIWLRLPEERIHFIEYGVLSFLVYRAVRLDIAGWKAYLLAFFLTFILGWIDEGIQELLPTRYYDNRDVILNGISGALGLWLTFIVEKKDKNSDVIQKC